MIRHLVEQQERTPNLLPKAPATQEEIGMFDIEIGELVEQSGVRVGVRLLDRPRHLIAAGATGSGKSTLLRVLINGIDRLNRKR